MAGAGLSLRLLPAPDWQRLSGDGVNKDQVIEMAGERSVYNGKAENGEAGPGGLVNHYNFCPTCGSTVFYVFDEIPEGFFPEAFERMLPDAIAFAAGSFADPEFPPPTTHANPELRPAWLTIHDGGEGHH